MAELLQKLSEKEKKIMDLLKRVEYIVERIDGDYAYLKNVDEPEEELFCRKTWVKMIVWSMK